jgi:hypothetical protein
MTQRNNAPKEVRIKKNKKMNIIQEKYEIYQLTEKPKTSQGIRQRKMSLNSYPMKAPPVTRPDNDALK